MPWPVLANERRLLRWCGWSAASTPEGRSHRPGRRARILVGGTVTAACAVASLVSLQARVGDETSHEPQMNITGPVPSGSPFDAPLEVLRAAGSLDGPGAARFTVRRATRSMRTTTGGDRSFPRRTWTWLDDGRDHGMRSGGSPEPSPGDRVRADRHGWTSVGIESDLDLRGMSEVRCRSCEVA